MLDAIGIATWNFRDGSLASRIERFAGMGFNAVSLISSDACALCRGLTPDVEQVILKHSLPVSFHGGFRSAEKSVDVDSLVADFELFVNWHKRTGMLRTVNYDAPAFKDDSGRRRYEVEVMRQEMLRMLSLCDGAGFSVGFEDWPRNAEQLQAAADLRAYAHFGILIDLGHLNMRLHEGGKDEARFPKDAAQNALNAIDLHVNELHIHNNNGLKDLHAPPTVGSADMRALGEMWRRRGTTCIATIEIVPAWCGLSEEEGWITAAESLEFVREVF